MLLGVNLTENYEIICQRIVENSDIKTIDDLIQYMPTSGLTGYTDEDVHTAFGWALQAISRVIESDKSNHE